MCLIVNSRCTTVWYYNMQPVVPDTRRPDGGSCCSHWSRVRLQLYDVKKKKIIKCIHWIKTMWAVVCCEYLEESSRPVWLVFSLWGGRPAGVPVQMSQIVSKPRCDLCRLVWSWSSGTSQSHSFRNTGPRRGLNRVTWSMTSEASSLLQHLIQCFVRNWITGRMCAVFGWFSARLRAT